MSSRRPRLLVSPKMRNKIGMTHHRAIGGRRSINKRFGNAAVVKASAAKIFAAASAACGVPVDQATQRGNIKVVVRVRPPNARESAPAYRTVVVAVDEKLILFDPKEEQNDFFYHGVKQKGNRDMLKKQHKDLKFCFDQVYSPRDNNEIIFQGTILPILDTLLNGFNCSVFAYGATGAGKTFTMLGTPSSPGLTFLTVMELYRRLGEMTQDYEAEVVVAYLEVYNEQVRDLLSSESGGSLNVLENAAGVVIPNLSMHKPENESQLLQMLAHGNSRRSQHPTDQNSESSRSHAVFQVFITLRSRFTDMKTNLKVAKLVMVDLAGSERGAATGFEGARFREGASINKSLLALGNCINALADGKRHIPFRDSKLTRILKDSLGGNCKTVMIANVGPSDICYDDTYNTLRYADRAKRIRFQVKKNIMSVSACISKYGKVVEEMTEKIENLKKQLEEKDKSCHCSLKKVDTATELSESFFEREDDDKCEKENMDPHPMDATTTIVKSTLLNETFTSAVVPLPNQAMFDYFEELSEKERIQRRDLIKITNTRENEERKLRLKSSRIQLVESFGSLDRMNNEKRLEKMNKQLESKMSTSSLLNSRMVESKQRLAELKGELTGVKTNLDASVKPDQIVKSLTLQELIQLEELKSELDARKISEAHFQKVIIEAQHEASHSNEILQQCKKLLLPLFKIVRQNGQLTESMETDYSDLMSSLCGAKVHWAANRFKSPDEKVNFYENSNTGTALTEVNSNVPLFGSLPSVHIINE